MDDCFIGFIGALVGVYIGLIIGLAISQPTELPNECILHNENIYCLEVAK